MIDKSLLLEIKRIITPYLPDSSYRIFIFGSRAKGTNRPFSDVDIGVLGPKSLPGKNYTDMITALDESDLPYRADIVDFSSVSDTVKKNAMKQTVTV